MNINSYDDFVRNKCCVLNRSFQLRSGFRTIKQLQQAVSIYKDPEKQEIYGAGRAYADIPESEVEGILLASNRFLPIRYVKLDKGTDKALRPIPSPNRNEYIRPVEEYVKSLSRQQSLADEVQETEAMLYEKISRDEPLEADELTALESKERELERLKAQNKELKFMIERSKVTEKVLVERELEALEEAGALEEGLLRTKGQTEEFQQRNKLLSLQPYKLKQLVSDNKEYIEEINKNIRGTDEYKPYSVFSRLGHKDLIKYLTDTIGIKVDTLYRMAGFDESDLPSTSGSGEASMAPETPAEEDFPAPAGMPEPLPAVEEEREEGREVPRRHGVREETSPEPAPRPYRSPGEEHTQTRSHDPAHP